MTSPHVVKVDSKGRVLIPLDIRSSLGIGTGTKIIVLKNENNGHFRMTPISDSRTVEVNVELDTQSSMASVADALSANSFSIILSESRMIDETTMWKILVELSEKDKDVGKLRDIISHVEGVKNLDIRLN